MSGSNSGFEPWPDDIWEQPQRSSPRAKVRRFRRRHVLGTVFVVVLLVLVAGAGWLLLRNDAGRGFAQSERPKEAALEEIDPPEQPAVDVAAAREQLSSLQVAVPVDDGTYERSEFRHWIDPDGDGCDTRCVVLKRQAVPVSGGSRSRWWSSYDRRVLTNDDEIEVDHVVSLKEAWISGASAWNDAKREVFANDLDGELLAVSAASNGEKSGSDVAEWQPRFRSAWCDLAARVIRTKSKWGLTVDPPEKSRLAEMLATCSSQ